MVACYPGGGARYIKHVDISKVAIYNRNITRLRKNEMLCLNTKENKEK